jgi:hypothetical protein
VVTNTNTAQQLVANTNTAQQPMFPLSPTNIAPP